MIAFLSSNLVFIVVGAVIIVGLLFLLRFLFPKLQSAEIKRAEITISPSSGLGLKIETFAQENSILSLEISHALNINNHTVKWHIKKMYLEELVEGDMSNSEYTTYYAKEIGEDYLEKI